MTGRATPRRVLADVLDLGAEASAALAIVTATALGALLRSPTDPPLRFVEVFPDHGWSPRDCDKTGPETLMMKVPTPVTITRTGRARNRRPTARVGLSTPQGRGLTPPEGASRLSGFGFVGTEAPGAAEKSGDEHGRNRGPGGHSGAPCRRLRP